MEYILGHSTHTDLKEHFSKLTATLNSSEIIQVSMDGPSVNLKFCGRLSQNREECELAKLVDIGTYGLQVVRGAFPTGAESTHSHARWED